VSSPRPEVSAIVLNYEGKGVVEEAVESLLAQRGPRLETIVVDNGSCDGSDAEVEGRFKDRVRLIRAGRNLGYGAGNNLGLREAVGRHVVLLNNDAVAAPGFVEALVAAAEAGPRVGMVAAKVLDYEQRDRIDTVGHLLYPDGLNRGRGRLETDRGQYDACRTALFPSGAAGLYRREMLDEIGRFDEDFFLYGDDAELGLRGRVAGWDCALAPGAVAFHRYSRSAGAWSPLKAFYVERNRVFVLLRSFPAALVAMSPAWTALRLALQLQAAFTGQGAAGRLARERSVPALVAITLRAWASALCGAPRMLRARRRDRAIRRLGDREFRRLLREFRLPARELALKD
jgi:GT2 family glycosyltransferase